MLPTPSVLPDGTLIRNCRIERRLGKGGFGITYLATEFATTQSGEGLGPELRKVAIKEFFPQGIASRDATLSVVSSQEPEGATVAFDHGLRAFYKEAQAIARFDHENVVRVHAVFEANGTAYFIMPFVEGETLRALLRREGALGCERAKALLMPVLDGLAHAHSKGILHRDLKPENVMIRREDGRPVLIDFGAARAHTAEDTTQYTRLTDIVAYTPGYAALEQYARAASDNRHTPATDLYAFGAMLYEAAIGQAPPESARRAAEVHGGHPDPLTPASVQLAGDAACSRGFVNAIDWALELYAKDRPQDIADFREALAGNRAPPPATLGRIESFKATAATIQREEGTRMRPAGSSIPPAPPPSAPPAKPSSSRGVLIGAVVVAAVGAVVYLGAHRHSQGSPATRGEPPPSPPVASASVPATEAPATPATPGAGAGPSIAASAESTVPPPASQAPPASQPPPGSQPPASSQPPSTTAMVGSPASGSPPSPAVVTTNGAAATEVPQLRIDCGTSDPAAFRVNAELGRLKVHDDLVGDYGFLVCEEKDTANDKFTVKITSDALTGTFVEGADAPALAKKLKKQNKPCEQRGAPYGPQGPGDHRRVEYLFCQKDGKPDRVEVRATMLHPDASAYPEQVLTVPWPK